MINEDSEDLHRDIICRSGRKGWEIRGSFSIYMAEALGRMKEKCHIIMYTENAYVKNMIEQDNPERWRRAEWKKAAGTTVQNKELWELFLEQADKQEIEVRFSKHSEYKETLRAIMNEEEV